MTPTLRPDWRLPASLLLLFSAGWGVEAWLPDQASTIPMSLYLPFHSLMELLSLTLSVLAFALLWWLPEHSWKHGLIALAACLLGAAWLDALHLLSYQGMPALVTPAGPEKSIAFWLCGRFLLVLGLLAMAWLPAHPSVSRMQRAGWLSTSLLLAALASAWILAYPESLPGTFVEGRGLTRFKSGAELLLAALLALAAWRLHRCSATGDAIYLAWLAQAGVLAALGELSLSSYVSVNDTHHVIGHLCKIAANGYITGAAYRLAVRQPIEDLGGLAQALQATLNPSFICDPTGHIRWVNKAFQSVTGYSPEQVIGQSVSLLSAEMAGSGPCRTLSAILAGRAWQGEIQARRCDGTTFVDERSVAPITNLHGHLTGYVIVGDDVTERSRRAQEVAEGAERLRALLQSAPDALVVIDGKGLIQFANPQVERLFGYSAADLVGRNVKLLMPAELASRHDGFLQRYRESGVQQVIGLGREVQAQRRDGSRLHVHLTVGEVKLKSGTVFIGFIRDISERIQAQAELRERESRYRTLMDTALDGVWIMDNTGRIVAVNEAYVRRSGFSREELLGMQVQDLEAREDPLTVRQHMQQVVRDGHDQFESMHRDKGGLLWPVEITVTHWDHDDGQFFVFIRDLTQRRATEQALKQSEERFELALLGTNDGLWDRNLINDTMYLSPRWKEMLGYRDDEIPSHLASLIRLLHPDDALRVQLTLDEVSRGDGPDRFELEMRLRHQDGHWVPVLSRGQLLRDQTGRPMRMIGTHLDLSERRSAERSVLESEAKLRKLFELSPLGIALCTLDGRLIDFNEAYRALTGYSAEVLRQLTYWDLTPKEYLASESAQIDSVARTGRYGPYEKAYRRMDGTQVPVRLNGVRLELHGEPHIWSIVEDLTETRRVEQEHQSMQRKQMQSQKLEALGHLTGGVAHDFNNMLAGIMGLASLSLERHAGDPEGKLAQYLREIVRTSERGRDLVAKMLAYARTEEPEVVDPRDIGPLVVEMQDMLATSMPTGMQLRCEMDPDLPVVRISAVDVHQIVMNLVFNARDAMGTQGEVLIRIHHQDLRKGLCVICSEQVRGRHVVLEVSDSGPGIPDALMNKIFDPFFTTKGVGKGTGLGLASVQGLVHKAGGHMQVLTTDRGTTMRVLLPAAIRAIPMNSGTVCESRTDWQVPADIRVWVVDDDPAVLVFLTELLREHASDVRAFSNPHDVLTALTRADDAPEVLITDQTMPGLSGVELARQLGAICPDVPVILCTGFSETVDESSAKALGIAHLLRKPFDARRLQEALADVIAHRIGKRP